MPHLRVVLIPILLFTLVIAAFPQSETDRWPFRPDKDEFREDAQLDLRFLNETEAGESGFVRVSPEGGFLLGSGEPVRFWAVNTNVARELPFVARPRWSPSAPDLARHARFLAKRGVNMVRLHAHLNPNLKVTPNARHTDIDTAERDWIWRTVAAMKKEGIYTTISPYWPNTMTLSDQWQVPGGTNQAAHGWLFFDEWLQTGYKAWMRALLTETNPYTGIPLAQDPAVAILQIQNEDSLLFWTVNNIKGEQRRALAKKYFAWVVNKYGTVEEAQRAWSNNRVNGDDISNQVLEFHNLFEMTQNRTGGFKKRLDDQLQFWTETMVGFYKGIATYLREDLGCRQLINAGNWKTGEVVRLNDVERYAYTANDVLAVNRYYSGVHNGPNRGWAIINNDEFTSPSILRNPLDFPLNLKQVRGYPMLVTESTWVMPMAYASEGPFLVAAYQSLTGIDGFFWFNIGDEEWTPPQSANGFLASQQKWLFGSPDMLGTFPAAALAYRMGYIREGEPVVVEQRALTDLWERRTPIIAESPTFDPNRDAGDIAPASSVKTGVDPLAFFVGPIQSVFDADPAGTVVADLNEYILDNGKRVRSNTGELELDLNRGVCLLDSPRAQGVVGFLKQGGGEYSLRDMEIRTGNSYGSVMVVSLDALELAESRRILVQVGTQSRPTGWEEEPKQIALAGGQTVEGFRVANFGRAPWMVVQADVELRIRNPYLTRATVLDPNGYVLREGTLDVGDASVRLLFPKDALYVVLE